MAHISDSGKLNLHRYICRLIKKYGFRHPLQSWGIFPNLNFSLFGKFFAFMIVFFGIIIFVVMLVQINVEITERKSVKELIDEGNYSTIEERVESFSPAETGYKQYESFEVSGVRFWYSALDDVYVYSKTSINGGVIDSKRQYLRISYYVLKGKNIIYKIEGINNQ